MFPKRDIYSTIILHSYTRRKQKGAARAPFYVIGERIGLRARPAGRERSSVPAP